MEKILELANPAYGYHFQEDPHHAYLLRLHGFGLVLAEVLDKWTPKDWKLEAEKELKDNSVSQFNEVCHCFSVYIL